MRHSLRAVSLWWLIVLVPIMAGAAVRNKRPIAENDAATTPVDTSVTINVTANDRDRDGRIVRKTVRIVGAGPRHGRADRRRNGRVTYTPDLGFSGQDTFRYRVKDNRGARSNRARVQVTVAVGPVVITSLQDDNGPDPFDGITNDDTPTLSGAAATDIIEVTLYQDGMPVRIVPVNNNGAWSSTSLRLFDGDYTFTATGNNAAGQESSPSEAKIVMVDTTAPTPPSNNGGGVAAAEVPGFICPEANQGRGPFLNVNGTDGGEPVGATIHKVLDEDETKEDDDEETHPRGSRYATAFHSTCSFDGVQGVRMHITDTTDTLPLGKYNVKFFVSDAAGNERCTESIETPDERCMAKPKEDPDDDPLLSIN